MNLFAFLIAFFALYILFGRKVAVPWGAVVYPNLFAVLAISFLFESLQLHFFYSLYDKGITKIPFFMWIKHHLFGSLDRENKKTKLFRWAKKVGWQGVFIISLLPSFGGGILTAALLVCILRLDRRISYFVVLSGGILSNTALALGTRGILNLIRILF